MKNNTVALFMSQDAPDIGWLHNYLWPVLQTSNHWMPFSFGCPHSNPLVRVTSVNSLRQEKTQNTVCYTMLRSLLVQNGSYLFCLWYRCSHTWKLYTYLLRFVASESSHLEDRLNCILSHYGEVSLCVYWWLFIKMSQENLKCLVVKLGYNFIPS